MVVYKNWTKGGLVFPKRGPCTSVLIMEDDVMHVMYNLIDICSSMLSLMFFVYPSMHTAYIENQRKLQVVAYKRLKTMENH